MERLTTKEVDQKIYEIINQVSSYQKAIGKNCNVNGSTMYDFLAMVGLPFQTFHKRLKNNQAFGLKYDKKTKVYYVNTDKPKIRESEYNLDGTLKIGQVTYAENRPNNTIYIEHKPKTLESIAEKHVQPSTRPKTLTSNETLSQRVTNLEQSLTNNVDRIQDGLSELKVKTYQWNNSTFFQRLRWLLTGRVS